MKSLIPFVFFLFFFNTTNFTIAQETITDSTSTAQLYAIERHDGVEYIGKILSDDAREILIETSNLGKIYLQKSAIKSITKIIHKAEIINGEYQQDSPFTTRYTFTTNALPIKKGENYALINLYGPEVHFTLSDKFSLGVMSTWIASPLIVAAKYTIKTKKETTNFSLGSLVGTSGYLNNFNGYGGLHFANVTFGNRTKNITFSAGYTYLQLGFKRDIAQEGVYYTNSANYNNTIKYTRKLEAITHGPILSVGGIFKIGARASFVFDSMIGVFSKNDINTTRSEATPSAENGFNDVVYVVRPYTSRTTALFVMPGVRFQSTAKNAFQISLAGVSVFRWVTNLGPASNFSFPIPMCSWFFKI